MDLVSLSSQTTSFGENENSIHEVGPNQLYSKPRSHRRKGGTFTKNCPTHKGQVFDNGRGKVHPPTTHGFPIVPCMGKVTLK